MRMKDSDDYITARAANPWTGLISPSIGAPTPRLEHTPDSPGEALHVTEHGSPTSPTPLTKERPPLKRANEGRKISSSTNKLWRTGDHGWLAVDGKATASPRVTATQVEGGLIQSRSQPLLNEDALVVHMPSAQEPQPYAYPGYSAKQIEAAEFYKRKARRVSNEGYDRRPVSGGQQLWSGQGSDASGRGSPALECGHITVANRRIGKAEFDPIEAAADFHGGAELRAGMFAPFISPKTPAIRRGDASINEMHTAQAPRCDERSALYTIPRKPLHDSESPTFSHEGTLKALPRVALVHPALAALPLGHPQRLKPGNESARYCSLGCVKDHDGVVCIERRGPSTPATFGTCSALFEQREPVAPRATPNPDYDQTAYQNDSQQPTRLDGMLASAIIRSIVACHQKIAPRLPRIQVVDVLQAKDKTMQQKIDALRQLLSTAGQAMILLAFTVVLWYVGSAAMRVLEVVLWPIIMPIRVLKWLGGARL